MIPIIIRMERCKNDTRNTTTRATNSYVEET